MAPRCIICIMDLLALRTISLLHRNGLTRTYSVLSYGHRGQLTVSAARAATDMEMDMERTRRKHNVPAASYAAGIKFGQSSQHLGVCPLELSCSGRYITKLVR